MDPAADPTTDPAAAAAATAAAAAASASVEPPQPLQPSPADGGDLTLVLSLVLPLLIAAYFLLFRKGGKGGTGKSVLLFGPMGAGKTSMHLHLRFGRHIPSHTSMQPTTATFVPKAGPPGGALTVVDAPGEPRLASMHLRSELPGAAVLVCVVDATALQAQAAQAAQVLYDVLTDDSVQRRSPPLIIAANHSDARGAAAPAAVRKTLETELQRVRLARTTMQDTSGRSTLKGGLADPSAPPFSFDQLAGPPVEVVATAAGAQPKLEPLLAAVRKYV